MAMIEVPIAPSEHPILRRWFEGEHLDLLLWESEAGEILKFRLLGRQLGDEIEGYSWDKNEGLRHGHFAASNFKDYSSSVKWQIDSQNPHPEFINAWKTESSSLPVIIRVFIQKQLDSAT